MRRNTVVVLFTKNYTLEFTTILPEGNTIFDHACTVPDADYAPTLWNIIFDTYTALFAWKRTIHFQFSLPSKILCEYRKFAVPVSIVNVSIDNWKMISD